MCILMIQVETTEDLSKIFIIITTTNNNNLEMDRLYEELQEAMPRTRVSLNNLSPGHFSISITNTNILRYSLFGLQEVKK